MVEQYLITFDVLEDDEVCFTGQIMSVSRCRSFISMLVKTKMKERKHRQVQVKSVVVID